MPTYVYETIPRDPKEQPVRFEVDQRMSAPALSRHPDTGIPVRRVISGGLGFLSSADESSSSRPASTGGGGCSAPGCGHTHH